MGKSLIFVAAILLGAVSALGAGTPIPHGTVELITDNPWIEKRWIASGEKFEVGLYFQLEKGWHVYWINPGDSGESPRVDWQLPSGLTAEAIEWPTPRRLEDSSSIVDYGYEDSVLLIVPMLADPKLAAERSIQIGADVKLLVCSHDMCIPAKTQLSLALPIGASTSAPYSRYAGLFADTRTSFPRALPGNWKFSVAETKDSFVVSANLGRRIMQATFLPLADAQIENAAPQKLQSSAMGFQLTLRKSNRLLKPLRRLKGVIVLSTNGSSYNQGYLLDLAVSPARSPRAAVQ